MELRHLRYFIAVAEELNFGRAAKQLQISQPPLSQQIHQLEDEIGIRLIDRSKQQIQLTDAGKIFKQRARFILSELEESKRLALRAGAGGVGELRVACMTPAHGPVVAEFLRAFLKRYSDVHVTLQNIPTIEQIEVLRHGRVDVGFMRCPIKPAGLIVETVLREPLLLAISEDHPLSSRARVPLRALADQRYIMFPRHVQPDYYDYILGLCRSAGFVLNIVQEQTDPYAILALVAAGAGVSLMPASVQGIHIGGAAFRKVYDPVPFTELALAYDPENRSTVLSRFLELTRAVAKSRNTSRSGSV